MRKPELENICKWIVNAWEELNGIIISKPSRNATFWMSLMAQKMTSYSKHSYRNCHKQMYHKEPMVMPTIPITQICTLTWQRKNLISSMNLTMKASLKGFVAGKKAYLLEQNAHLACKICQRKYCQSKSYNLRTTWSWSTEIFQDEIVPYAT